MEKIKANKTKVKMPIAHRLDILTEEEKEKAYKEYIKKSEYRTLGMKIEKWWYDMKRRLVIKGIDILENYLYS